MPEEFLEKLENFKEDLWRQDKPVALKLEALLQEYLYGIDKLKNKTPSTSPSQEPAASYDPYMTAVATPPAAAPEGTLTSELFEENKKLHTQIEELTKELGALKKTLKPSSPATPELITPQLDDESPQEPRIPHDISKTKQQKRSHWILITSLIFSFLMAAIGIIIVKGPWRLPWLIQTQHFNLGAEQLMGLIVTPNALQSANWMTQKIININSNNGTVIKQQNFPSPFMAGFTINNLGYFSSDPIAGEIHLHDQTDFKIKRSYISPIGNPAMLYGDDETLWLTDQDQGKIYQYKVGKDLSLMAEYRIAAKRPMGLQRVGKRLFLLDGASKEIQEYQIEQERLRLTASYKLEPALLPQGTPVGFAIEKPYCWIITKDPSALHKIPISLIDLKLD